MARLLPPEMDIGVLRPPVWSCLALAAMFVLALLAMGLLERIGVASGAALASVVAAAFVLFVLVALMSHSRRAVDFYVADRTIAGVLGGLAGVGSLAGLVLLGVVGGGYGSYPEFLISAAGLAIGYLVLGALIAPGLRASGAYTVGDFLATRYGDAWVRLVWAAIAFASSFLLLVADLKIAGPLVATLLPVPFAHAFYFVAGLAVLAMLPGGMRSLTWTQAIQCFVIALACVVPLGFFMFAAPDGENAKSLTAILGDIPAFAGLVSGRPALPVLLMAVGAASLPPLMARSLTARSPVEAGASMLWSAVIAVALLPPGLMVTGFLSAGTAPGSGIGVSTLAESLDRLPAVLAGLLVAGVLAALLALGQASLFSAATALSHDIYDEIVDRTGPEGRRILVARAILIGVAAGGAMLAMRWPADPPALLAWSFALAAAGIFGPLVLAIWWRRSSEIGTLGGMVAGAGFTGLVRMESMSRMPASSSTIRMRSTAPPSARPNPWPPAAPA